MRTLVIALLALALPQTAQAGLKSEPMPSRSASDPAPINGGEAAYRRDPGLARTNIERQHGRAAVSLGDGYYQRQLARARDDIDRRRERGELSRSEARLLRREIGRIRSTAEWYGRDGLSTAELGALELRASELRNRTATGRAL